MQKTARSTCTTSGSACVPFSSLSSTSGRDVPMAQPLAQLPTDCGYSRLQAPARLHTTTHNSDTTLVPRLHHSTTPRGRPRKTDSFHSTLSTRRLSTRRLPLASLHAAFSARFYFHGASPLPSRRAGGRIRCCCPQGEVAPGTFTTHNQAPTLHQL